MRQLSAKVWVSGTVLVALLLLVGVWLLLIDPVMTRAADDSASAEQQRAQNDVLQMEIVKLADDFTHLDEYKAQLAELRLEMPVTGDGASITRELQSLATAAGVTITSVSPSVPVPFVPAASASAAVADSAADPSDSAGDVSSDGTSSDGTSTDGTGATAQVAGLYSIPISIATVGTYDSSVTFLRSVQSGASRLYLVSSIDAQTQQDQGASGGRPATAAGDVALTISGYAYVLTDGSAPVTEEDEGASLPTPSGQPNPFAPVG